MNYFKNLKAEEEIEWLDNCLVFTACFEQFSELRSSILLGDSGAGKTVMKYLLKKKMKNKDQSMDYCCLEWDPYMKIDLDLGSYQSDLFQGFIEIIIIELLKVVLREQCIFQSLRDWQKQMITDIVKHVFVFQTLARHFPDLCSGIKDEKFIEDLFKKKQKTSYSETDRHSLLQDVINSFDFFNVAKIVVLIDGFERYEQYGENKIVEMIEVLFSFIFSNINKKIIMKLFIASIYEPIISKTDLVAKGFIWKINLDFSSSELNEIVKKRLKLERKQDPISINEIGPEKAIYKWLMELGEQNPRNWLLITSLIYNEYIKNDTRLLDNKQVYSAIKEFPFQIIYCEKSGYFMVNSNKIGLEEFSNTELKIFLYLLDHPRELVSKQELYYCAYLELDEIPGEFDEGHSFDKFANNNIIDVCLHRLRKIIEPNSLKPILLETVRNHGVKLNVIKYSVRNL